MLSPVRTEPKGWLSDKRRFVVNMRYLNKFIPEAESKCELETLSKIRNIFQFPASCGCKGSWGFTMDLTSGYHNIGIHESQWGLMGIVLEACELPPQAISWLEANAPDCREGACFYFQFLALPFGLASSCAVFSDVVTALAASWRRHHICLRPVRLSSYIDDFVNVAPSARAALVQVIEIVYETTAVGLTLAVHKCRFAPITKFIYLGIVVDTVSQRFRLPAIRAKG